MEREALLVDRMEVEKYCYPLYNLTQVRSAQHWVVIDTKGLVYFYRPKSREGNRSEGKLERKDEVTQVL